MNKDQNGIYEMIEDVKFCKMTFGEYQFNRKYNFYKGYIECLFNNDLITEKEYKLYNAMLEKTWND